MSSLLYLYHLVFIGQKDTNTKTELCFSLRLPPSLCLPPSLPPSLSPSCPVMCSGQTVWLLGVSGMIIETEASKDIPRCLVYPETSLAAQALLLYRRHFSCSPQRTVASCAGCGVRIIVVQCHLDGIFFFFLPLTPRLQNLSGLCLCGHSASDFQPDDRQATQSRRCFFFLHYLPSEVNAFVLFSFFISMHAFQKN